MSDDWDTSGHGDLGADPYNKFEATAASAGQSAEESVTQAVAEISVSGAGEGSSEQSASEQAPPPAAAAPPAEAAAPPAEAAAVAPPVAPEPVVVSAPAPSETQASTEEAAKIEVRRSSHTSTHSRKGSVPTDAPAFLKESHTGDAFTEKLEPEALAFFNELCEKPFNEQAVSFLNAYWEEVGDQAEFIFTVGYEMIRYADMHAKGVQYVHLYDEGNDLDFNIGLYFYEKLCKKVLDDDEGKKWRDDPKYKISMPEMMTAIKRKIELREKVDCNFDGRVSFLEYLLYQYQDLANPADFTQRAMKVEHLEEHPEIVKARNALAAVNKAIQEYEAEKHRLTELAKLPGVKGLGAKHQLAILDASPLAEQLNKALITAEAAVRIASRKFGDGKVHASSGEAGAPMKKPTQGAMWWMNRDLEEKQKLYGKRRK